MIKSNNSVIKDILIIDLKVEDLFINNSSFLFSKLVNDKNLTKVILNLEELDVITSIDINKIDELVKLFKLSGIETIICNFNPYSASLIFTFIDEIKFNTALNIEEAINDFSNR